MEDETMKPIINPEPEPTQPTNPPAQPKQEEPKMEKEKMSDADLSKYSLEELQAAIEKKKQEVKKTGAESLDWTKMSLEEVRAFVVNQALAAGKDNPTFSDEFVKDYKRVQIEKQLEREEKEKEKNALIKDATMEQVYDWILKKNEGRFYISTGDLETLIVFDKCPYNLDSRAHITR